jgi:hypothetical protein
MRTVLVGGILVGSIGIAGANRKKKEKGGRKIWWLIMNFFRLPALNLFQMINFSFFFFIYLFF